MTLASVVIPVLNGVEFLPAALRSVQNQTLSDGEHILKLGEKFGHAKRHLATLARHASKAVSESQFFEFGAGWDLAIPLSLFVPGIKSQVLVDISELARVDLINDAVQTISRLAAKTAAAQIDAGPVRSEEMDAWVPLLERRFGVRYVAPCDARSTPLEAASVDCITSTDTPEHIPEEDIRLILRECRRILRKHGVMSFVIDYQDHYSYCDRRITAYNFLRYSRNTWKSFNPRFHFQNRLRHSDYIRLAREESFDVVEDEPSPVLPKDLAELEHVNLDPCFRERYLPEELAIRRGHLVLRPASA